MQTPSLAEAYAHLRLGFDLAAAYLTRPVVMLGLLGAVVLLWLCLRPRR
jgi:hypothetical protein